MNAPFPLRYREYARCLPFFMRKEMLVSFDFILPVWAWFIALKYYGEEGQDVVPY